MIYPILQNLMVNKYVKKVKKVLLICLIAIIAGGVVGVATRSNKIITPNEYLQLDQIDELSKIGDQENLWLNQRCLIIINQMFMEINKRNIRIKWKSLQE